MSDYGRKLDALDAYNANPTKETRDAYLAAVDHMNHVEGRRDELATFKRMKPLPLKVPLPEKPVLIAGNSLSEDLHEKALKEWKDKVNQAILENIPDGY